MGPFAKYWGPGRRPAGLIDVHSTPYVATEHRHVREDSLFSATVLLSTSERQLSPG